MSENLIFASLFPDNTATNVFHFKRTKQNTITYRGNRTHFNNHTHMTKAGQLPVCSLLYISKTATAINAYILDIIPTPCEWEDNNAGLRHLQNLPRRMGFELTNPSEGYVKKVAQFVIASESLLVFLRNHTLIS